MIIDLDELIDEIKSQIHIMGRAKEYVDCIEYVDKTIFKYLQILICLQAFKARIEQPPGDKWQWLPNRYLVEGLIPPEFLKYDIKIPRKKKKRIKKTPN